MPGWYIHMDVARQALATLSANPRAASLFGSATGPTAAELTAIAEANPAYVALGAIGPDIFFLLPDFKPPAGTGLWGAASTIRDTYTWWDENWHAPWEDAIGPLAANAANDVNALTGGLAQQLSDIAQRAFAFLKDALIVLAIRQYDVFSFLGSGVQSGYDEQVFFWSDMLHYRKTYELGAHLWQKANAAANDRFRAFALGWITHLATDVAGHCFVNEKSGGPYRLHWQRHHLVENHMDAEVYDGERGSAELYQMISSAALHLWIAFNPDGSSRESCFPDQPGPDYQTGDDTPAILDRKSKWDVDSDLPADLAAFLADALREVYNPTVTGTATPKGAWADHPTIISDLVPGSDGYPVAEDIEVTYWWLYHYVKWTTTDYFTLRRPDPPDFFVVPPFPSPPGAGASDPGPGAPQPSDWQHTLKIVLAIFSWIAYLAEVAAWPAAALIGLATSAGTYPIRELLYEAVELPLYNAWLALHWYLSITGFVYPMQHEINRGLTTLGVGVTDFWDLLTAALDDISGGLVPSHQGSEPSGHDRDPGYPHDAVVDPPSLLNFLLRQDFAVPCSSAGEAPSEFASPWLWPAKDHGGDDVPSEAPLTPASPYVASQDAPVLMGGAPGSNVARSAYQAATSESDTLAASAAHLPAGEHLGDPVDYTAYVVAWLTRDHPADIANFNLDSDRGYGYLCWDWVRSPDVKGVPQAFQDKVPNRAYHAPLRPGYGWCQDDIPAGTPQPPVGPDRPLMHDPTATAPDPVRIRYIDREVR